MKTDAGFDLSWGRYYPDREHNAAVATALATASLADLAVLTGLLAAECCRRHVQVAGPLGLVAARLEMLASKEGPPAPCPWQQGPWL